MVIPMDHKYSVIKRLHCITMMKPTDLGLQYCLHDQQVNGHCICYGININGCVASLGSVMHWLWNLFICGCVASLGGVMHWLWNQFIC